MKSLMRHWTMPLLKLSVPFAVIKKKPDVNSIFEYFNKELHNSNITSTLINNRLSTLTIDGKLEIKYPLGKTSYWVKDNNAQESCKSKTSKNIPKTPISSPSLPSPPVYETSIIESKEDTVGGAYRSLGTLLNYEVISMKSFIEDQMLILRQSRKYSKIIL